MAKKFKDFNKDGSFFFKDIEDAYDLINSMNSSILFYGKGVGEEFLVIKDGDQTISFYLSGYSVSNGNIYCCIYNDFKF